jgi:hypothetical protein
MLFLTADSSRLTARKAALNLMFGLCLAPAVQAGEDAEMCQPFYDALNSVPHESIYQDDGECAYTSTWFEACAKGCLVVMNTSVDRLDGQTLPDMSGEPDTPVHKAGWRINPKYIADGPGTGVVGLEKNDALCFVYTEQPAQVGESGGVTQSRYITVRIECMEGAQGKSEYRRLIEKPKQ